MYGEVCRLYIRKRWAGSDEMKAYIIDKKFFVWFMCSQIFYYHFSCLSVFFRLTNWHINFMNVDKAKHKASSTLLNEVQIL